MDLEFLRKKYTESHRGSDILSTFNSVLNSMNSSQKSILEVFGETDFTVGGVFVYGTLTNDGLASEISLEASVKFPNPLHFNGFVNEALYSKHEEEYKAARKQGSSQLAALLATVDSCDARGMPREEYEKRCKGFRDFVEVNA